ncbi:LAMI_0A07954g1_1 [Lachancea mirantina]|uniref:Elongator complex protein 2 n=1 Tax=Lachancea mirantina TaxID=1230905 RepID=A0A1G4IRI9_9SACH|nr:LAMI_0A07954g1_1 [Lachancea mirantina]
MISNEAIFIGANKQVQVSDYQAERQLVAFGAGKTIALWNPLDSEYRGVFGTLKGHNAEVTCVRFVTNSDLMISASEDSVVRLWRFTDAQKAQCIQVIEHHKHSITCVTVDENVFAVGCADGSVSLWAICNGKANLEQELRCPKGIFPLCLALKAVGKKNFIMALGGTAANVFVYSFDVEGGLKTSFQLAAELEGHEDWIKALDFYEETSGNFILASGSQDRYIRLWRIKCNNLIGVPVYEDSKLKLLSNKLYKFSISPGYEVAINFEALIIGHDDWVSSVRWHPTKLQLLASTADTALMIWEPDELSGVWVCATRLGELSSKGASTATGSAGGFWSCLWFNANGRDIILTNGKTGSWRKWISNDALGWDQDVGISGASREVTDVAWSPNGRYLLSTSLDQTTRLFAQWVLSNGRTRSGSSWHEFSRCQIHGYDLRCIEPITTTRFVSGSDEKVMRSFDEPKSVAHMLERLCGIPLDNVTGMPESASLPVLGLSSKAVVAGEDEEGLDPDERETNETKNISYSAVSSLDSPPFEDQLGRHTLWPEMEKLYGHGYEISCIDVSPDRSLIASACKSNTLQHAAIRIFSTESWSEVCQPLAFHNLTITRLCFAPDNDHILSVSRDRQWAIWKRGPDNHFNLINTNEKAHTRIIWDGDWAPAAYGRLFITASRDKTLKAWKLSLENENYELENTVKIPEPVTAVAVHHALLAGRLLVAVGTESGAILLYLYDGEFKNVLKMDSVMSPAERITRIRWNNSCHAKDYVLGVSSEDHSCRIYRVPEDGIKREMV